MAPEHTANARAGSSGAGRGAGSSVAPSWWERLRQVRRSLSQTVDPAHSARAVDRLVALEIPALLLLLAHDFAEGHRTAIFPLVAQQGLLVLVLLLNRWRRHAAAGHLYCLSNWALVSWLLLADPAGLHHVALLGFPAVLLVTGLLLDLRFMLLITALVVLSVVGITTAEVEGWTTNARSGTTTYGWMFEVLIVLLFSALAVIWFARDIRDALLQAREQEARLGASTDALRRQTEVLQGTAQKLATAMELAVEGLAHADENGRITDVNTRACEITGFGRTELIGRMFTDLFSAEALRMRPVRWDLLDRGLAVTTERTLVRRDGTAVMVEMTSQRLPDRTLQCFVRDITTRRAQDEASRQRQRLEALGTLAGGVAHDFNNLLTVMHGALDTIAKQGTETAAAVPLQDLRNATERANDLTRQLLAFARQQPLDRRQLDLRGVVEQNGRLLRRLLNPQIEFVITPGEEPCPVFADAGALAQVFTNLVVNARDAMPKGGRLELGCRVVTVATPPASGGREIPGGEFVCARVADNGCGIPEEVRRQIFEPFFTTKGADQGTGLGLSVSLGIIEQHGGWIEVATEVGRGTEFRVYLPRQELAAPTAAATPAAVVAVRGSETILLVEDEEPVRRLAAGALTWCGFRVIEAATGVEALRLWDEHGPQIQLLLTDVAMPGGVSGVDLAQSCRGKNPTLPILITSGYNQEEVGFGPGCWDDIRFLPKPYTMAALTRAARETLDTPVRPRAT